MVYSGATRDTVHICRPGRAARLRRSFPVRDLPSGTVTFLYTDVEGSTRRWEAHPAAMRAAMARHDALLRGAIEDHGGGVFRTMGDALFAALAFAQDAVAAPPA